MKPPTIRKEGDAIIYHWPTPDSVEIEIDNIHRKGDDWLCWMAVRTRAPGMAPHLSEGSHNLGAMQSRTALSRHLETRMPLGNRPGLPDWASYLEMACVLTVRGEKEGQPFTKVGNLPPDQRHDFWLVEPLVRIGHPTIIFGDGGTGKSTLAALIASCVVSGIAMGGFTPSYQGPVLWLDWETDREEVDQTIKLLREGHDVEIPEFIYRREVLPLYLTAHQARKIIDREGVTMTVVDSVGYAFGGKPDEEVGLRFFSAVRALNCTSLLLDHVVKAESGGKPIGTVYKHNEARLTFELKATHAANEMHVGVYQRKANRGGFTPPFGLRVEFGENHIRYGREEIREAELVKGLNQRDQVERALGVGDLMTAGDISTLTGIPEQSVKARLSELVKADKARVFPTVGTGHARRYALLSERDDAEAAG